MEQKNKEQTSYYWLGPIKLEIGSIIFPGNWGRIINLYTGESLQNLIIFSREQVFEKVRIQNYSTKPSRLTSIFLCKSKEELDTFRQLSGGRLWDIAYKVEIIDNKPIFETDYTFANFPQGSFQLQEFEIMAHRYWKGENIQHLEILTESRIKIIQKL
ncbi:MAG: DUF2441 domain-containing protein [Caldisericia bacterium]|jgi:hypothetical protein|nr:DUF2441 domain-containing protein [Caldisericia bacterium]